MENGWIAKKTHRNIMPLDFTVMDFLCVFSMFVAENQRTATPLAFR